MESAIAALKDTPIPTIMVVAGIAFLLLAIAGQLAGRIAGAPERQRWAAVIGGGLLAIGVALHVLPQVRVTSPATERVSTSRPSMPPAKEPPPQPSVGLPTPQPQRSTPEPPAQASTEEKEPNNNIRNATLITEGITVHGSIATLQDRDFFTFTASSPKTRIILLRQFSAAVDVYNRFKQIVNSVYEYLGNYIIHSFESTPGATYYIVVKPIRGERGDYQLVVQKE